jgi:hypothetical protein
MKQNLIKSLILATVFILLGAVVVYAYLISIGTGTSIRETAEQPITNFEECVQAGYAVLESYPARCITPEGESFTQVVEWEDDEFAIPDEDEEFSEDGETSEFPAAAERARAEAASFYNTDIENAVIVSAEYNDWPDGCLGLAAEDEMCITVITPGYYVLIRVDGIMRAYRTDIDGTVIRQETSILL